jgi:hypothetical protein
MSTVNLQITLSDVNRARKAPVYKLKNKERRKKEK